MTDLDTLERQLYVATTSGIGRETVALLLSMATLPQTVCWQYPLVKFINLSTVDFEWGCNRKVLKASTYQRQFRLRRFRLVGYVLYMRAPHHTRNGEEYWKKRWLTPWTGKKLARAAAVQAEAELARLHLDQPSSQTKLDELYGTGFSFLLWQLEKMAHFIFSHCERDDRLAAT